MSKNSWFRWKKFMGLLTIDKECIGMLIVHLIWLGFSNLMSNIQRNSDPNDDK